MASKIDYLKSILAESNIFHLEDTHQKLTLARLNESPLQKAAFEVYQKLGGINETLPEFDYSFDIELLDKAIILDEDLAFNKYRTLTFRSSTYYMQPEFPIDNYRRYCRNFEKECLKAGSSGANWTNTLAENFFGKSNDNGDLGLTGSSQWKYRAYQDFVVDLSNLIFDYKVIRVSIYDSVMANGKITMLKELLLSRKKENEKYILALLKKKISASEVRIDPFGKKYEKK